MRYPYDDWRPRRRRRAERPPYDRWFRPPARYRWPDAGGPAPWPRAFDAPQPRRRREDREEPRQGERRLGERRLAERRQVERRQGERRSWRERYERLRERRRGEGWIQRGREFFRRYREPIIGLTVAGAAAPIAKGIREAPRVEAPPPAAERVAAGRRPPIELEEEIGRRWAASEEEVAREDTIRSAMGVYGIPRRLAEDIHDTAIANDLEPELAYGLVKTESAFNNRAVSNVGARGLTQVMPRTARWLRPGTTVEDLFDRRLNLDMGFGYLRDLIDKYRGNVRLALLAYNRGPGTVDRVLRRGGDPDNGYADKVLSGYDDLGA